MGYEEIAQAPIVRITDDWTGEELDTNTKPTRYTINGQKYDLYLSRDSRAEVDAMLDKITSKGKPVGRPYKHKPKQKFSEAEAKQRKIEREAYARAHGRDPETARWSEEAHRWYEEQHAAKPLSRIG